MQAAPCLSVGSDESTREFIQLRYKLRHLFNGRKHQCEKAYSRIVDELGLRNVISPTQARKKWSNLLQKYMDIKGGYSTASPDWPYFQILDQIVPLMRKEKIEKLPPGVDGRDLEGLPSPLTSTTPDPDTPTMPGVTETTTTAAGAEKCKVEAVDATSEPPRKRGRSRRAAQRARDRWWGAVEDSDLGVESGAGSGGSRSEVAPQVPQKMTSVDSLEPSQMELQTFNMLETCSTALTEIRDVLKAHTERQERFMQSLQQTITNQNNTVKEVLSTVSTQNATLISLITQLTSATTLASTSTNTSAKATPQHPPPLGMTTGSGGAYTDDTLHQHSHGHSQQDPPQQQQLLASQQSLMSALTQRQAQQQCDSPMVDSPELTDSISGL